MVFAIIAKGLSDAFAMLTEEYIALLNKFKEELKNEKDN